MAPASAIWESPRDTSSPLEVDHTLGLRAVALRHRIADRDRAGPVRTGASNVFTRADTSSPLKVAFPPLLVTARSPKVFDFPVNVSVTATVNAARSSFTSIAAESVERNVVFDHVPAYRPSSKVVASVAAGAVVASRAVVGAAVGAALGADVEPPPQAAATSMSTPEHVRTRRIPNLRWLRPSMRIAGRSALLRQ